MIHIIFILVKLLSAPSCPMNGGNVILEEDQICICYVFPLIYSGFPLIFHPSVYLWWRADNIYQNFAITGTKIPLFFLLSHLSFSGKSSCPKLIWFLSLLYPILPNALLMQAGDWKGYWNRHWDSKMYSISKNRLLTFISMPAVRPDFEFN